MDDGDRKALTAAYNASMRYIESLDSRNVGATKDAEITLLEGLPKVWPEQGMSAAQVIDRKSTRLNSSHSQQSRMPSSA